MTCSTSTNYNRFAEEFVQILSHLHKSKSEVIITGDFNIDLLKINSNANISKFYDTVTSQSFYPKITLSTRFSDRHGTLID